MTRHANHAIDWIRATYGDPLAFAFIATTTWTTTMWAATLWAMR